MLRTIQYITKTKLRYLFGEMAPHLFCLAERYKNGSNSRSVRPDTYLVVEGYPRCSNTYISKVLQGRLGAGLHVAHHIHLPFQVRLGVNWKRPTMVLVRSPKAAVVSYVSLQSHLNSQRSERDLTDTELAWRLRAAVRDYFRFYEAMLSVGDGFVMVPFENVVNDTAHVFHILNERFSLKIPCHTVETREQEAALPDAGRSCSAQQAHHNTRFRSVRTRIDRMYDKVVSPELHQRAVAAYEACLAMARKDFPEA